MTVVKIGAFLVARKTDGGFDGLVSLGIECENCGRTRRLSVAQIRLLIGGGIRSVEDLGKKLSCKVCAERGKMSKNVTIIPQYRCEKVATLRPL